MCESNTDISDYVRVFLGGGDEDRLYGGTDKEKWRVLWEKLQYGMNYGGGGASPRAASSTR